MLRSLVVALGLLTAVTAQGQPTRALDEAITVGRQSECLRADALGEHVRTWLGRDAIDARLSVVVDDEGEGASFVVVQGSVAQGVRRFDRLPSACEDRRAALGLAIALAIDAAVLDAIVDTPARAPAAEPARGPSVHLGIEAQAQVLIEVSPEVAGGLAVGARLDVDRLIAVRAAVWISTISSASLPPGSVSMQLAAGALSLCLERPFGALVVEGCVGAVGGTALGRGQDVPAARESAVSLAGLTARVGALVAILPWMHLEIGVDGWLALARPRFDLLDGGVAVRSVLWPLAGLAPSLGVLVELW